MHLFCWNLFLEFIDFDNLLLSTRKPFTNYHLKNPLPSLPNSSHCALVKIERACISFSLILLLLCALILLELISGILSFYYQLANPLPTITSKTLYQVCLTLHTVVLEHCGFSFCVDFFIRHSHQTCHILSTNTMTFT